jgi:hypothetical protein
MGRDRPKNGYLPRHEENLVVTVDPSAGGKIADVSKSELLGGKSLWKIHADLDARSASITLRRS